MESSRRGQLKVEKRVEGGGWGVGGGGSEEESASDWSTGAIRQVICSRLQ